MFATILQKLCYLYAKLNSLHSQSNNAYPNHCNTPLFSYVSERGDKAPSLHFTCVSWFLEGAAAY